MKLALRASITILLIAAILWWLGDDQASGAEKISRVLAHADLRFVGLAFLASTIDRVLMAFKWKLLLASRGVEIGFLRALKIYCTAMLWGLLLPSTVGADVLRAGMTMRAGLPPDHIITSIVVERMVGFFCSLVMSLFGLVLLSAIVGLEGAWTSLWWIGSLLLIGAIGVIALSLSRTLFDRVFSKLPERVRRSAIAKRVQDLHGTYVDYCTTGRTIGAFMMLTFVENVVTIAISWLCALALGVEAGLLFVAGAVPLAILVSRLPLSIDGIGVFESAFAACMWLGGIPEYQAVAIALLGRVVQIASWLPWWLGYVFETRELRPANDPSLRLPAPR